MDDAAETDDVLGDGTDAEPEGSGTAAHDVEIDPGSTGLAAAYALRRARRRNRLVEMEWFELLYRVYLAAFLGGGAILWLSDLVPDSPVDAAGVADVVSRGPAAIGLAAIVMLAAGLRSGANGGPLAVEDADVRHMLMAPVSQARVLVHPAVQRFRTLGFAGALAGGVIGQLAGRRLPGTELAWAASGALFGAACGALFVAGALITHGLHAPRWAATLAALAVVSWQAFAAADRVVGPADALGEVALWGMNDDANTLHLVDVVSLVVVALVAAASLLLLGSMSMEALSRRSALVSQLRFAVTLQDMRTVMLLRRQLAQEHSRARPWIRLPRRGRLPVTWRRGWHGILRFPTSRLVRMVALVAVAAVCQVLAWRGTTPAIVGSGVALFVLGLELLEPLSQEVDQSDRTDSMPTVRGEVHVRLALPSVLASVVLAVIGGAVAVALQPSTTTAAVAAVIALPTVLGGMAGAALNIVGGAPDPMSTAAERTMMPPEVAGTTTIIKAVWPVVLAVAASVPVIGAREAAANGSTAVAGGTRFAVFSLLIVGGAAAWLRFRDEAKAWLRASAEQGNAMRRADQGART